MESLASSTVPLPVGVGQRDQEKARRMDSRAAVRAARWPTVPRHPSSKNKVSASSWGALSLCAGALRKDFCGRGACGEGPPMSRAQRGNEEGRKRGESSTAATWVRSPAQRLCRRGGLGSRAGRLRTQGARRGERGSFQSLVGSVEFHFFTVHASTRLTHEVLCPRPAQSGAGPPQAPPPPPPLPLPPRRAPAGTRAPPPGPPPRASPA